MEQSIFYQLSIVMVIAALVSLVMRIFRQPLVIGYILTGFLVSPSLLDVIHNHEAFESFSQIGICLLLFIIGIGLNIRIVKDTGKPVAITFLAVVAGIGSLGFLVASVFGFNSREALILATALLFSSTIIVVKSLSDKKEQSRLYGQIALGLLLAEDLAATFALVGISALTGAASTGTELLLLLVKGFGLAVALSLIGGQIMPRLSKIFASSQELLYVFGLAWAFGVASVFQWAGFSLEVGALFAGVSLAHLPYVQAISSRLKPLRDFFLVLFFIRLGEELGFDNLTAALLPAIAFTAITIFVKPLIILTSLGSLGYTKQTSFKTAVHLSQISEFSIVFIALAASTKLVGGNLVAIMTLTALLTIAISAYLMQYDDRLYKRFAKRLSFFERSETKRELRALNHYPLILLGYREGGYTFVQTFREMKKRYVVIDYDPAVIDHLEHQHINHLYGDVTDTELLDEIGVHKSELIISTLNDASTNRTLARHITHANPQAIFICHANSLDEAEQLYEVGASYVLLPTFLGNEHINNFIKRHGSNKDAFMTYRSKHLLKLGDIAVSN